MARDNENQKPNAPVEGQNFFPGNASRVRNRTVTLNADLARQLREMATVPMQIESDGWSTPRVGAGNLSWDGQAAFQMEAESLEQASESAPEPVALTPIVGFLVSYDRLEQGEVFPIRQGRSVLTGQPMKSTSKQIMISD